MMTTAMIPDAYVEYQARSSFGNRNYERRSPWDCAFTKRALVQASYVAAQVGFSGDGCRIDFGSAGAQRAIAQETLLHSFSFNTIGTDGAAPTGNLVFDTAGNLYGETSSGGSTADAGMIYELSPQAGGGWTEKIIYAFGDAADGSGPNGGLIFDGNGNLYGAASKGVFELSPQSGSTWTLQVLYTPSGETDIGGSVGGLIFDKSGNLYGALHILAEPTLPMARSLSCRRLSLRAAPGRSRFCIASTTTSWTGISPRAVSSLMSTEIFTEPLPMAVRMTRGRSSN